MAEYPAKRTISLNFGLSDEVIKAMAGSTLNGGDEPASNPPDASVSRPLSLKPATSFNNSATTSGSRDPTMGWQRPAPAPSKPNLWNRVKQALTT